MHVLAGAAVGLRMERDLAALLLLQCEGGGWEPGWMYKSHTLRDKVGNRGLTTAALALNAIAALHPQQQLWQEPEGGLEAKGSCAEGMMAVAFSLQRQVTTMPPELAAAGTPVFSLLALAPNDGSRPPQLQACNV